jgi:hypothetical protein
MRMSSVMRSATSASIPRSFIRSRSRSICTRSRAALRELPMVRRSSSASIAV